MRSPLVLAIKSKQTEFNSLYPRQPDEGARGQLLLYDIIAFLRWIQATFYERKQNPDLINAKVHHPLPDL